ncbi:MAG: hypothetical protein ABI635_08465 [Actinomycetota bacterium]
MKLARSIGPCFFVIAALVQMPTGASAATVQHIILPTGVWNATVTVTGKDADNILAFGMRSPQDSQICPTGEGFDCTAGAAKSFTELSGELVFYLTDVTCDQTFLSTDTDPASAQIDQVDSTHWTIGWDDAGGPSSVDSTTCDFRDGDFNDLTATIVADSVTPTQGGVDFAAGNYDGVNTLDISTAFGPDDLMRSEIIVPPSTGADGYQAGPVTDDEQNASGFPTFCGGLCDAQVDVSMLPSGSQAGTTNDPGTPIKVILYYRGTAVHGDAVYAQGDGQAGSTLLSKCFSSTMASVDGVNAAKCVASDKVTTTGNGKTKIKIKTVVVLVPSGGDPIIGKG